MSCRASAILSSSATCAPAGSFSRSSGIGRLEQALSEVEQLSGLLPICAYCSRVRDDRDYWEKLEHTWPGTAGQCSHGICPDCYKKTWRPELERRRRERGGGGT